jgi:K(+)-stimulated pyrophosphate-energized sodium pump
MAADLFETYAVTVVATMVLGAIFFGGMQNPGLMLFPLAIGAAAIITSIIGTFFVKLGTNNSIMGALYKGFIATWRAVGIIGWAAPPGLLGWGETPFIDGKSITGPTCSLRRRRPGRHRR